MSDIIETSTMNVTPMTNILVVITDNPMKPLQTLYELIDNCIDSFNRSKLLGVEIKNPLIDIRLPSMSDIKKNKGVLTGLKPEALPFTEMRERFSPWSNVSWD